MRNLAMLDLPPAQPRVSDTGARASAGRTRRRTDGVRRISRTAQRYDSFAPGGDGHSHYTQPLAFLQAATIFLPALLPQHHSTFAFCLSISAQPTSLQLPTTLQTIRHVPRLRGVQVRAATHCAAQ